MKQHPQTATRTGILALALLAIFVFADSAIAIPRFSLLTGTRCSACHFDPQGSGLRTELGWSAMNEVGLFKWRNSANDTVSPTNKLFNGMFIPGLDARLQLVRVTKTGQELLIPMQLSTSLAFIPTKELSAYGDVNLASIEERIRGGSLYPGEADFDAQLQYQPSIALPSIRVGMIEPSIGIRQDDHTVFVNREAALKDVYLFPAYYNDIGAEITYEGLKYLTINAGVFNAHNLSQVDPTIGTITSNFDFKKPTVSARVMFWPQLLEQQINGEAGASIMQNGAFQMINVFAGIGLTDKATISVEAVHAKNSDNRIVRNFTVMGTLRLADWLATDWRYDWGQTELFPGRALAYANAFTFGLEFFVLPYIELRPEYRLMQSNPFYGQTVTSGQYTGQIHIFY